ncbi:hypothetical protein BDR26DRAFT_857640 [Obelidium mucronatum]|nr:hypothetical protein BDR26DRAFT_857640 [Obelidium mucronatum]
MPQYRGIDLHILIVKSLPVLYHLAVGVLIIYGLVTDPSNVAAYIYFTLSLIEHIGWIIIHAALPFEENNFETAILFVLFHLLVNVGFGFVGMFCFQAYTGYDLGEYVVKFGFGEWLRTLPRLFQLMYFQIWLAIFFFIAGCCIFGSGTCVEKGKEWYTKHKREPKEPKQPAPAPLVAISTVSPIS